MTGKRRPIADRLFSRVVKTPTCWLYTGSLRNGYGQIREGGKGSRSLPVHRVSYELLVGQIPDGFQIDHLCRVRNCVNPAHLEPVTPRTNLLRGFAPAALNARLDVCKKAGHPLVEGNLCNDTPGHRRCKRCRQEYERERGKRRSAARRDANRERVA